MTYQIVPCEIKHLRGVAGNLRAEEIVECEAIGAKPRHMMFALWRSSIYRRAAIVDGRAAAVWGDAAPVLSAEGHAWLFTTPLLDSLPIAFLKVARAEVGEMLRMRSRIRTSILDCSKRSRRFWYMIGFQACPPDAQGLREIWIEVA